MKTRCRLHTSYVNYKGGVNNLQVVALYKTLPMGVQSGFCPTIKVFTSTKMKAEKYAQSYAKKNNYEII